jgi:nucleoside recognition membrane protein YjiH
MENSKAQSHSLLDYLYFIVPSLVGIFLFMIPIQYNGEPTIPVALLANWVESGLSSSLPYIMTLTTQLPQYKINFNPL